MLKEISELPGCEAFTNYRIESNGKVWSYFTSNLENARRPEWRVLKNKFDHHGYPYVILKQKPHSKTIKIHRLLGLAFIPNPDNKPQINHINGIKSDYRLENLEWVSSKENCVHAIQNNLRDTATGEDLPNSILTDADVIKVFEMKCSGMTNKSIGAFFNIDYTIITRIIGRNRWKHVDIPLELVQRAQKTKCFVSGPEVKGAKLTAPDIARIRNLFACGKSKTEIGRLFNVGRSNIYAIVNGKSWNHV